MPSEHCPACGHWLETAAVSAGRCSVCGRRLERPAPTTGRCSTCGYSRVAFGAPYCPQCGARNPNPGVADRYAGPGMLIGLVGGGLAGGVLGYFFLGKGGPAGAFGGVLVGAIPGLVVGLVAALGLAAVSWLGGKR